MPGGSIRRCSAPAPAPAHPARKELKNLKIEAKSVSKQRELNKGLENKIISLQQRHTESKDEIKVLRAKARARRTRSWGRRWPS